MLPGSKEMNHFEWLIEDKTESDGKRGATKILFPFTGGTFSLQIQGIAWLEDMWPQEKKWHPLTREDSKFGFIEFRERIAGQEIMGSMLEERMEF